MIKEIENFSNYFCDDSGFLWTRNWKNKGVTKRMKPGLDKKGYLRTVMVDDLGKYHTVKIHRVIGKSWIENPKNKPQINHKDGIKTNNKPLNLEWVTNSENQIHAVVNGLCGYVKINKKEVLEIRDMYKTGKYFQREIAKKYNLSRQHISDIINRKKWAHV